MDYNTTSGSRQSAHNDASPSTISRNSGGLYRAPTWARQLNFDTSFDLATQPSAEQSGFTSPSDGLTGLALSGSPRLGENTVLASSGSNSRIQEEPGYLPTNRSGNLADLPQPRISNNHTRQLSNTLMAPSRHLLDESQSERSTLRAITRPNIPSMLLSHQRVASASSPTGITDFSRSSIPSQLHSSADLYAAADNRPRTSMSTMSAHFDDSREERMDSGTSHVLHKRASVLSFQTARSDGGDYYDDAQMFASAPASELEVLDRILPPKPWLINQADAGPSGTSSFHSSTDDRHLPPGGWANAMSWRSGLDEGMSMRGPNMRNSPTTAMTTTRKVPTERGISPSLSPRPSPRLSPSLSPRMTFSNLNETKSSQKSSTLHSRTPSGSQSLVILPQDQKAQRPASMLRNDTTEDLLSAQSSLGFISGPSTVDAPFGLNESDNTVNEPVQSRGQIDEKLYSLNGTSPKPSIQPPIVSQTTTTTRTSTKQETRGPAVPEKPTAPLIPAKDDVGLSSPPLSDNVIPPPLPIDSEADATKIPLQMPASRSPVADFRRTPLVAMAEDGKQSEIPRDALGADAVQSAPPFRTSEARTSIIFPATGAVFAGATNAGSPMNNTVRVGPGVGAHAARNSVTDQAAPPAFAALMRKPSNGSIPRTPVPTALMPTPLDRSPTPSIETPPREESPPPEGEVEARAEWERGQRRRMAERDKRANQNSRKTTFRGQMKPLQLVAAEDTKRTGKNSPKRGSPVQTRAVPLPDSPMEEVRGGMGDTSGPSADISRSTSGGSAGLNTMTASASPGVGPSNGKGGGMSTQQLQRQLARDQRRSVHAVNMNMGQMGMGDIGGAYPVFSSPSTSPSNIIGGIRQYSGLMPQRSLVPPFELQNRPDGLPSALMGPDGIRRSPNDPEVCLECMMRDEDMIDVHVLGARLWERESDVDFAEAIRLEGEEDVKREKARLVEASTMNGNGIENGTSENSSNIPGEGNEINSSKEVAATVAVGSLSSTYPRLSKIRVKRVAKGEPLTAERLKLHTQMNPPASSHRWRTLQTFLAIQAKYIAMEQKARGTIPPAVPPKMIPTYDNAMVKTSSGESRPSQRHRVASPALFQVEEVPLTAEEKTNKERDITAAREARRKNNALPSNPATIQEDYDTVIAADDEANNRLSGPPIANDHSSGHHSIPRRSTAGPSTYIRAGSIQDLRTIPNTMAAKRDVLLPPPLSPHSLAPPQAPFRGPPSPGSPRTHGTGMRSVSSQMSMANSGSMIDMHVGLENSKEHRISQAGFIPGTPLHSQSPSALNRAFYGFPGDGDTEQGEDWNQYRGFDQSMANSFGDYDDGYSGARSSPELEKKKKKSSGLRGLFGKKSGKDTSDLGPEDDSIDSRDRRSFMRPDSSMELQPPPGVAGLLSRARRSTSSLLIPSGRQSIDSTMMLGGDRGFSNPLMASQTSLEMGPFGSGPQAPPRKDSRLSQVPSPSLAKEREKGNKSASRLRAFSSGNLMAKKKLASIPNPTSRTSSMMQNIMPPIALNGQPDDRLIDAMRPVYPEDQASAVRPRTNSYAGLSNREVEQYQDGQQHVRLPLVQNNGLQDQYRNEYNGSNVLSPNVGGISDLQTTLDDGSMPKRPPRNPDRSVMSGPFSEHQNEYVEGIPQSRTPLFIPASLQKEQYFHSYDSQPRHENERIKRPDQGMNEQPRMSSSGYMDQPTTSTASAPSRKSKLLKLTFGKNKRESAAVSASTVKDTNSLRSRSSRGTFDDNGAGYYGSSAAVAPGGAPNNGSFNQAGLDSLRGNPFPRRNSNASWGEDGNLPPRSQSAMGTLDANMNASQQGNNVRGFFPRLRTSSRAALREVTED